MISLDTVLFKINMLTKEGMLDEAILTLDNAIKDDLVNTEDEKELSVKLLHLLLLRKTPEDIELFKKFCSNLKQSEYSSKMTESIYTFISYLLTFGELEYNSDELNLYKTIMSYDKGNPFSLLLSINEISFSIQNPEERFSKLLEIITEYKQDLSEEQLSYINEMFKRIKYNIISKTELNSDDNRMLELFYLLNI